MLNNELELVQFVRESMGATYEKVSDDGFKRAATQASQELNWQLPLNDPRKEYWMVERTKRFVIYILLIESAHKFQYKKIYLQHRFQHYIQLLKMMDDEFLRALDTMPDLFDTGTYGELCAYITVGFSYDITGNDITNYLGT
jgi:hypothetical protein